MTNVNSETPQAKNSRQGTSAVPPLVWILVAVIAVMALAIGFLLGREGSSETASVAQPTTVATATDSDTAGKDTAGKDSVEKDSAAGDSGKAAIDVTQPKVGKGAQLWGASKPVKELESLYDVHRRDPDDPFAIGKVDAPVVMSEFSDFECPFCSRHANQVSPQLMKYVEDGTLRIEWNDLPVNGAHAVAAAKAGRAAAAQGKFEEYKNIAYKASQDIPGHPNFEIEDFVGFAKQAGVKDLDKFRKQATDSTYDDAVENAKNFAAAIGISGTPGFIVGGTFISGAQPLEAFQEAIEKELDKAKNA